MSLQRLVLFCGLSLLASAEGSNDATRKIENRLIAPCCWRESVAFHGSPEAERIRTEIAAMVKAGQSEREIEDHYVAEYGERILLEPRGGRSIWLTATPFLLLAVAGAGLIAFLRRARKMAPVSQTVTAGAVISDDEVDW